MGLKGAVGFEECWGKRWSREEALEPMAVCGVVGKRWARRGHGQRALGLRAPCGLSGGLGGVGVAWGQREALGQQRVGR